MEEKKYFYLYKVINILNNKIYIGAHRTNNLDDGYMGSGKILLQAYKKYGLENFKKEILKFFENSKDMFKEEAQIVNEDFLLRDDVYNLVEGGGGWTKASQLSALETKRRLCVGPCNNIELRNEMVERARSPESIAKRKQTYKERGHAQGEKNSQFGTMWITNEAENKKIKKDDLIPEGWKKGRTVDRNSK